ncbi:serine hydrolase [uncultured Clostridium sp.]|uniref:serine hydrolase n=1 Tax=uncultured Clostridium sp. TaxID=59620 RepID=UPI00261D18D1|nr:serine hydrolase [uncultured Clostridium sp.]
MKRKVLITALCLGFVGFFVGCGLNSKRIDNSKESQLEKEEKNLSIEDLKVIEEAKIKVQKEEAKKREQEKVERIVVEETREYRDNIGFYYYNLDTKVEYSINEDKEFRAASTIKLPLVMMVMDDVYNGKLSLDTILSYNKNTDYEGGTGSLQHRKKIEKVSVAEAVKLAITTSDNIAYKMLNRNVSMSIKSYVEKITGVKIEGTNHLTAKQAMLILKHLYENPDDNPYYNTIIKHLKNTVFHKTMDKYIPYEKVAHKIGSYYRYYHDIGIVYGGTDYIMVMYTKDVGELPTDVNIENDSILLIDAGALACEITAKISERIYNMHVEDNSEEKGIIEENIVDKVE